MKVCPAVVRVQPLYQQSGPRKISVKQAGGHNARVDGDIAHIDISRSHLNKVMLGSGQLEADMAPYLKQYKRASKNGPVAGEVLITAHKEFFVPLSEAQCQKWADDSLAWALAEFDSKNNGKVVSCVWHRDEESEHLHLVVVPIVPCFSGNQYKQKTELKINYAECLGKPRGGEKHLEPAERRWGKKQTSYANHMAEHGHNLVRGVKNRRFRKHKTPAAWRQEIAEALKVVLQRIYNVPEQGMASKKDAVQYVLGKINLHNQEFKRELAAAHNRAEALEQIMEECAKMLGCECPAQLPSQVKYLTMGLASKKLNVQEITQEGQRVCKQIEAKEGQNVRRKQGQRASRDERRAARATRKMESQRHERLNQITHQITFMPQEAFYARDIRNERDIRIHSTGGTYSLQESSYRALQPGQ